MASGAVRLVPAVLARALATVPTARTAMTNVLNRARVVDGGRAFTLASLPPLLRTIFSRVATAAGLVFAAEMIMPDSLLNLFDLGTTAPQVGGNPPMLSTGDVIQEGTVVSRWNANGTPFVKLADGRLGARRKDGSWKFWKPKKPIVLMPGGASDLRSLLRADTSVDRQLKKLDKAMKRRGIRKPQRRAPQAVSRTVIAESGPGDVK